MLKMMVIFLQSIVCALCSTEKVSRR